MQAAECRRLLLSLLEDSEVQWEASGEWIRFRFCQERMIWELACRCGTDEVLIYSRYPMQTADRTAALAACDTANRALTRGAMFLSGDAPTFRLRADLQDPYGARERLAQALRL